MKILIIIIFLFSLFLILSSCSRQTDCQLLQNLTERNDCYKQQAITGKDLSSCEKIQPEQQDASGVFIILARMDCYNQIAALTKNASLCYVYARYNSASICVRNIAVAEKDSSVCAGLDMEKDLCYYRIAILKSDVNECKKMSDSTLQDKCQKEVNGGEKYYCMNIGGC
ncbi:MAG: hypothetical protein NT001_07585 [Candidatus Woesearchaeota archaeon]|nr:hypothetical protein [Candidatus Woesearchaeota archaeon]